jgi:xanthine dehydrogenase accessory factor
MLAICEDGRVVGSVSGGCIEDDMIDRARREGLDRAQPAIVTYGVSADEARRFGLPCGGTIELAIEPLSQDSRIDELLQRLQAGELVARRLTCTVAPSRSARPSPASPCRCPKPRW